jgi:hypothetical protein
MDGANLWRLASIPRSVPPKHLKLGLLDHAPRLISDQFGFADDPEANGHNSNADGRVALAGGSSPCHRNSVAQSHNVTAGIPGFMGAAQPIPHDVGYVLSRGRRGGGGP